MSASTTSTGDYGYLTHHSIIRNGLEVEGENNVVAMEFHYDDPDTSHLLMMGTFLAPYTADFGSSRTAAGGFLRRRLLPKLRDFHGHFR